MTNEEFFTAIENSYKGMNKQFPWDSDYQEFIDWTTDGIKAGVITSVFDSETGLIRYYHKEINSLSPITTPARVEIKHWPECSQENLREERKSSWKALANTSMRCATEAEIDEYLETGKVPDCTKPPSGDDVSGFGDRTVN
jgi:hypothetical protein